MRRQCVPGSLSPPPKSEPGFEARGEPEQAIVFIEKIACPCISAAEGGNPCWSSSVWFKYNPANIILHYITFPGKCG